MTFFLLKIQIQFFIASSRGGMPILAANFVSCEISEGYCSNRGESCAKFSFSEKNNKQSASKFKKRIEKFAQNKKL